MAAHLRENIHDRQCGVIFKHFHAWHFAAQYFCKDIAVVIGHEKTPVISHRGFASYMDFVNSGSLTVRAIHHLAVLATHVATFAAIATTHCAAVAHFIEGFLLRVG